MLWKSGSSSEINQIHLSDDVLCQSSDIFKLDIKCFKKLFDYLCQRDLITVGATCKYLSRIAGYCFQQNYSAVDIQCGCKNICINYLDRINHFNQSIRKIRVYHYFDDFHTFRYIHQNCHLLKKIEFTNIKLTRAKMECIKRVLSKIEILRIDCCEIDGNFHKTVLVFCKKLKHLSITGFPDKSVIIGTDNGWLSQKYPTLENLELLRFRAQKNAEIINFLTINPNIRRYLIPVYYLWMNKESIMNANVKLDKLEIIVYIVANVKFVSICHFLNQLYNHGFYKHLHLYHISSFDQTTVGYLSSLQALVKLRVPPNKHVELSALRSLEQIRLHRSDQVKDLEVLINNCSNLKGIHFSSANFDDIQMLVGRSMTIQKIQIEYIQHGTHFNVKHKVLDLTSLNNEREKLHGAKNVTIYVKEDIYLATKWKHTNMKLHFIEVQRLESFEWDHAFGFNLF